MVYLKLTYIALCIKTYILDISKIVIAPCFFWLVVSKDCKERDTTDQTLHSKIFIVSMYTAVSVQ